MLRKNISLKSQTQSRQTCEKSQFVGSLYARYLAQALRYHRSEILGLRWRNVALENSTFDISE